MKPMPRLIFAPLPTAPAHTDAAAGARKAEGGRLAGGSHSFAAARVHNGGAGGAKTCAAREAAGGRLAGGHGFSIPYGASDADAAGARRGGGLAAQGRIAR